MSEQRPDRDETVQRIALGVVAACLFYAGSLATQVRVPAVRGLLAIDLGPGVKPTYYLRSTASLLAGGVAFGLARLSGRRAPILAARVTAWLTAFLLGLAALVAVTWP